MGLEAFLGDLGAVGLGASTAEIDATKAAALTGLGATEAAAFTGSGVWDLVIGAI